MSVVTCCFRSTLYFPIAGCLRYWTGASSGPERVYKSRFSNEQRPPGTIGWLKKQPRPRSRWSHSHQVRCDSDPSDREGSRSRSPRSRAAASPRRFTFSFTSRLCTWFFTVATSMESLRAISLLEQP